VDPKVDWRVHCKRYRLPPCPFTARQLERGIVVGSPGQ
jgi:hypothetical protein